MIVILRSIEDSVGVAVASCAIEVFDADSLGEVDPPVIITKLTVVKGWPLVYTEVNVDVEAAGLPVANQYRDLGPAKDKVSPSSDPVAVNCCIDCTKDIRSAGTSPIVATMDKFPRFTSSTLPSSPAAQQLADDPVASQHHEDPRGACSGLQILMVAAWFSHMPFESQKASVMVRRGDGILPVEQGLGQLGPQA